MFNTADNKMGLVPNFQKSDVAEALELIAHMLTLLSEREKPDKDDIGRVRELAKQIRQSR